MSKIKKFFTGRSKTPGKNRTSNFYTNLEDDNTEVEAQSAGKTERSVSSTETEIDAKPATVASASDGRIEGEQLEKQPSSNVVVASASDGRIEGGQLEKQPSSNVVVASASAGRIEGGQLEKQPSSNVVVASASDGRIEGGQLEKQPFSKTKEQSIAPYASTSKNEAMVFAAEHFTDSADVIKDTLKQTDRKAADRPQRYDYTVSDSLFTLGWPEATSQGTSEVHEYYGKVESSDGSEIISQEKKEKMDFPFVVTGGNIFPSDTPKHELSKHMVEAEALQKAKQKLKPPKHGYIEEGPPDRQHVETMLQKHLKEKLKVAHQGGMAKSTQMKVYQEIDVVDIPILELIEKVEQREVTLTETMTAQLRERFVSMSTHERREYYKCGDRFLISEQIASWQDTGQTVTMDTDNEVPSKVLFEPDSKVLFEPDALLNSKVALWNGDISRLELDVIVNSTSSLLMDERQGMNAVICVNAGPLISHEMDILWHVYSGEVAVTAGYCLPAKYVYHTSGPPATWKDREVVLQRCYRNALNIMKDNGLRTLAFPCISTGAKGLPRKTAAQIALETTREWLQENHTHVDKIVFCVYEDINWKMYQQMMPTVFPVRPTAVPKSPTLPAEILRMDNQSIHLYKKALSEGETSVHSIRVMVVGHYGVGKTTLTKRLLEEDVDLDARDSTNGIDVHVRRCRVSLADQKWTVLKKGEFQNTLSSMDRRLKKGPYDVGDQHSPRSACASAQSDPGLCWS